MQKHCVKRFVVIFRAAYHGRCSDKLSKLKTTHWWGLHWCFFKCFKVNRKSLKETFLQVSSNISTSRLGTLPSHFAKTTKGRTSLWTHDKESFLLCCACFLGFYSFWHEAAKTKSLIPFIEPTCFSTNIQNLSGLVIICGVNSSVWQIFVLLEINWSKSCPSLSAVCILSFCSHSLAAPVHSPLPRIHSF